MCSLGACHTPSGGGSRCYSTCLPDHPPPSLAVQTHILTAPLFSFSCAGFLFYFTLFSFSSSHFVHLTSLFLQPLHQIRQKKTTSVDLLFFFFLILMTCYTCPLERQKLLALTFVCNIPKRVVTWWHEWAPLLAAAGPWHRRAVWTFARYPSITSFLHSQPPALHPASSSILQQWATVTEPHCVWCGCTQTQPLLPFQKAQPSTWVIFKGICSVKYLAGAGHEGELVRCG